MVAPVGDSVRATPSRLLLLTELFPPAIGGSAVLFQGIYSRVERAEVTVLTDGVPGSAAPAAE